MPPHNPRDASPMPTVPNGIRTATPGADGQELVKARPSREGTKPAACCSWAGESVPGKAVNPGDLVLGQAEAEEVKIRCDPIRLARLRDHCDVVLQMPAQHDLGWGHAVCFGDARKHRITERRVLQRAV